MSRRFASPRCSLRSPWFALLAALVVTGGLELLARKATSCPGGVCPIVNSEGFADGEWTVERTPGVRRIALVGRIDPPLVRALRARLAPAEVLDMTAAPPSKALVVAARYRPDLVLHGLARSVEGWSCPSRALTFAIAKGRAFLGPEDDEEDGEAVARTRKLCEVREAADSFGASVRALVAPDPSGRFASRALRSCATAGVPALVVREETLDVVVPSLGRSEG